MIMLLIVVQIWSNQVKKYVGKFYIINLQLRISNDKLSVVLKDIILFSSSGH